jgi:hypothetical protein
MTILFDTNVLLDVLLGRTRAEEGPFLLDRAREGSVDGAAAPTVLTNTFYVGRITWGEGLRTRTWPEASLSRRSRFWTWRRCRMPEPCGPYGATRTSKTG